jgi:hypothetical protein
VVRYKILLLRSVPILFVALLAGMATSLDVVGQGEDVTMKIQCLDPATITKLTGSSIPDSAPKQACYTVVNVSAKSSGISQAISNFVTQSAQLQSEGTSIAQIAQAAKNPNAPVASAPTPAPPAAGNSTVANVVNSIVSAAVTSPSPTSAQTAAATLSGALSTENKATVAQQLESLSSQTPDPSVSTKLNQAAQQLRRAGQ